MNTVWIDTPTQLAEACAGWRARPWITVDTEFVRVETYRARLCLVQVGDGKTNACIDTLALEDLAPLWAVLADLNVLKVLHASSQDFEIVVEHTGSAPTPVFDTQIAATLMGMGDQIGYAGLVERSLGVVIDKRLARTDWSRRPLSDAEIAYAADDVRHLATLYPALQQQVADAGRLDWLAEDCQRLTDVHRYAVRPEDAWRRLKGLGRLDETGDRQVDAGDRVEQPIAAGQPRPAVVLFEFGEARPCRRESIGLVLEAPDSDTRHEITRSVKRQTAAIVAGADAGGKG